MKRDNMSSVDFLGTVLRDTYPKRRLSVEDDSISPVSFSMITERDSKSAEVESLRP